MASNEQHTFNETGSEPVGEVLILSGAVHAIAADGTERALTVNSPVFAEDRIITESDGTVSIVFHDEAQTALDLGRMSDVLLDEDVYQGQPPADLAEVVGDPQEVGEIVASLPDGMDGAEAEDAAILSAGGGSPIVTFAATGAEVTPESGADDTAYDDDGGYAGVDGDDLDGDFSETGGLDSLIPEVTDSDDII